VRAAPLTPLDDMERLQRPVAVRTHGPCGDGFAGIIKDETKIQQSVADNNDEHGYEQEEMKNLMTHRFKTTI